VTTRLRGAREFLVLRHGVREFLALRHGAREFLAGVMMGE